MNDDTMTHEEKMQRDIGKMEGLVGGLNAVKKLIREHDSTPGSEIIEARRNI